jgi:hypothetical protein
MKNYPTCTNCKALNRLEWECNLGYKVIAGKRFHPRESCPKPVTDEEFNNFNLSVDKQEEQGL